MREDQSKKFPCSFLFFTFSFLNPISIILSRFRSLALSFKSKWKYRLTATANESPFFLASITTYLFAKHGAYLLCLFFDVLSLFSFSFLFRHFLFYFSFLPLGTPRDSSLLGGAECDWKIWIQPGWSFKREFSRNNYIVRRHFFSHLQNTFPENKTIIFIFLFGINWKSLI